jgi:hypothetical protein
MFFIELFEWDRLDYGFKRLVVGRKFLADRKICQTSKNGFVTMHELGSSI